MTYVLVKTGKKKFAREAPPIISMANYVVFPTFIIFIIIFTLANLADVFFLRRYCKNKHVLLLSARRYLNITRAPRSLHAPEPRGGGAHLWADGGGAHTSERPL